MQTEIIILTIFITIFQLFSPAMSPAVPGHKCGLAAHRRFENTRKKEVTKHADFRKWGDYFISIKDPPDYALSTPLPRTPRVYWNLTSERCDYRAMYCMKTFKTGVVCGRTIDYIYYSFPSYCILDFYNCLARLDNVWSIAYMGYCVKMDMDMELYVDMTYDQMSNNSKLLQMYIADVGDETDFQGYATTPPPESTLSTSTVSTTIIYNVHNVTDENGTAVTDAMGNQVTFTEIVTVPYANVTDEDGSVVTDYDGDYVTYTLTTPASNTTESTNTTETTNTES